MQQSDLKKKTVSGIIWKFMEKFSIQFLVFLQSIIMARLLSPSDYGLVGMVAILNGICAILVDSGLTNAIIRKKDPTKEDFSTIFIFNVGMNLLMAGLMVVCAPLFATFYNQPTLKYIIYLFALQSASGSLLAVQGAKMTIDLRFKALGLINVITTVMVGIISVVLAFMGYGVYALVIPNIVAMYIRFVLYYYYQHWFPGLAFSWKSFKELFGYGSKMMVSNLINCIFNNIYPIVIGKKFSPADLGYYTRGQGYAALPSSTVSDVITNVTLPILSKVQEDTASLASIYRRMLRVSAYVVFPVMVWLAVMAKPAVVLMISSKWIPCVEYLQILCFSMMWLPIISLNQNLLQAKGFSNLYLRITVFEKALLVLVLVVTIPFGLRIMCFGSVVVTYLTLGINTYYTGKIINFGFFKQLKDFMPFLLASIVMGGSMFLVSTFFVNYLVMLLVASIVGFGVYLVETRLFKFEELGYITTIVKENILKR